MYGLEWKSIIRLNAWKQYFYTFLTYYVIINCLSVVLAEIEPLPAETDVDFHDVS